MRYHYERSFSAEGSLSSGPTDLLRRSRYEQSSKVPEAASQPIPTDHRLPRRNVRWPVGEVITVSRDKLLLSAADLSAEAGEDVNKAKLLLSAAFLAVADEDVNRAKPVMVVFEDASDPELKAQRAFQLPDGRVAVVSPFDRSFVNRDGGVDCTRVSFPVASPNDKHVYMDEAQLRQAVSHGSHRMALSSADFNAGYNIVKGPAPHRNDQYFNREGRV